MADVVQQIAFVTGTPCMPVMIYLESFGSATLPTPDNFCEEEAGKPREEDRSIFAWHAFKEVKDLKCFNTFSVLLISLNGEDKLVAM